MPRLTYKKLALLVSEKLHSIEMQHDYVEAYNARNRGCDIEAGACLIMFKLIDGNDFTTLFGFQWISEIEEIVNTGNYSVKIIPQARYTITDSEILFVKH